MAEIFLTEFGDLSNLTKAVPHREHRSLFAANNTSWTCVDFTNDWVAVGTNTGWLYLYDRFEEAVKHRLTTQPSDRSPITKVRLKRTVEYVVAIGAVSGFVSIFQLPTPLARLDSKLQVFAIRDLHHSPVTCLEWSQNAMKLFSGDEDGVVVCTEIDYALNESQSYVVCKEPHSVVQLSYAHRTLLVSTRWRTVLCTTDTSMNVTQVGRKDRKILGPFGAVFVPGGFQPQDAIVYCARPNLSLWKADITGTVSLTIMFKSIAANLEGPIGLKTLEKETSDTTRSSLASPAFSRLFVFGNDLLLTYFENGLFVMHPRFGQFLVYHATMPEIIDVAVNDEEVLLLMKSGHGTLRFLARHPFRTKMPSSLIGLPLPPPSKESQPSQKSSESTSSASGRISAGSVPSWLGALKDIGNVMENVRDGVTSAGPDAATSSPEMGQEATSPAASESVNASTLASIPIIHLDPTEIKPLRIEPEVRLQDVEPVDVSSTKPTLSQLPAETVAIAAAVVSNNDDIVFESKIKKKVKKKAKVRRPLTPDVISISSTDSAQRDQSVSPVEVRRRGFNPQPSSLIHHDQADVHHESIDSSKLEVCSLEQKLFGPAFAEYTAALNEPHNRSSGSSLDSCVPSSLEVEMRSAESRNEPSFVPSKSDRLKPSTTKMAAVRTAADAAPCDQESKQESLQADHEPVPTLIESLNYLRLGEGVQMLSHDVPRASSEQKRIEEVTGEKREQQDAHSKAVKERSDEIAQTTKEDGQMATRSCQPVASSRVTFLSSPTDSFRSIYQTTNDDSKEETPNQKTPVPTLPVPQGPLPANATEKPKSLESWFEIFAPGTIKSLHLTNKHAWCVERESVYYAALTEPIKWVKIDQSGQVVSVSPDGFIAWILYKNSIYAATKVTAKSPAGSEWREVARDVSSMCVDDHVAWYTKLSGEVMMQKELHKGRTSFRAIKVPCDHHCVAVVCCRGVVWAVTDELAILVRNGISKGKEEGTSWIPLEGRQGFLPVPSNLSIGSDGLVWAIDVLGRVWFTTDVTSSNPQGSGFWWEISVGDCLVAEPVAKAQSSWGLTQGFRRGAPHVEILGTIAAGPGGEIWVTFSRAQSIFVSNGTITGHRWETSIPPGMLPTTKWRKLACCSGAQKSTLVWLEQSNGDMFCMSNGFQEKECRVMEIPPPLFHDAVLSLAAISSVLWCLMTSEKLFVRSGMSGHCLQGVEWVKVDLAQLGSVKLAHCSVSLHNVWAVDSVGSVFLRIGVKAPSNDRINQAWIEVDRKNLLSGCHMTQVASSPNSAMVWAVDSKSNVYVRAGVSESLPLGTNWINIPGVSLESILVSNRHVFGRTNKDSVVVRYGITPTNPLGEFWKRIPGKFHCIAVNDSDDLWAIDKDGQLNRRLTYDLEIVSSSFTTREKLKKRNDSVEGEWEVVF